ncbi:MAG: DUF5947 family protein [Candidatus Binataceae bacterium]
MSADTRISAAAPHLRGLRAFVPSPRRKSVGEVCELCGVPLGAGHSHLVNMESRNLCCSCRACYLLFTAQGAGRGRYLAVPDRYLHDRGFALTQAHWDAFQIPVRIAFFFYNSLIGRIVALYPCPAGATESMLDLRAWDDLGAANPVLKDMQPDVEALLVYGHRRGGFDCFIVPIDACYELTGVMRRNWKGFDGGEQAWAAVDAFFDRIRERSHPAAFREQPSNLGAIGAGNR